MSIDKIIERELPLGTYMNGYSRDSLRALLLEAVEAERKNAERYRFVRAEHDRIDPICRVSWKMFGQRNSTNWGNVIDGEHLDELVAAAIAAEGK